MFGQVRLLIASLALVAACDATAKPPPVTPVAEPTAGVAAAPQHAAVRAVAATAPCRAGATCEIRIDATAIAPYHINREYPHKFVPSQDPALAFEKPGELQVADDRTGSMTVKFRPARSGDLRIAGVFKIGVCTEEECQIEEAPIAVAVRCTDR